MPKVSNTGALRCRAKWSKLVPMVFAKILSIGTAPLFHSPEVRDRLQALGIRGFRWFSCEDTDEALDHFFQAEPIQLLLVDETVPGLADLLGNLKGDEVFEFLPVILLLKANDADHRKVYFPVGVEHFLDASCQADELVRACHVALKYKLQLDSVMERLRMVTEENITRAIQLDILQKFLPQTVWERSSSLAEEQDFDLPEAEADLAIVFADIQSFTSRAETLSPGEVIRMLNTVFPVASRWVYAHGGDIDKFIGDAFFAVFSSTESALAAALAIQGELADLSVEGAVPLQFRMGVHHGRVIRGSVGGERRWDHTLIGDVVNTAQRLESNAPAGGVLVSRAALESVGRPLNPALVFETYTLKGKGTKLEAAVLVPGDLPFLS